MRRHRQGKIDIVKIVIFGALVAAGGWVWLFAPHMYAEWKMNDVLQVSLLEWSDKNSKEKGEARFVRELDKREIPEYILADDCDFFVEQDGKHIECEWSVEVRIPLTSHWEQLDFYAHKAIDSNRNLHDYGG